MEGKSNLERAIVSAGFFPGCVLIVPFLSGGRAAAASLLLSDNDETLLLLHRFCRYHSADVTALTSSTAQLLSLSHQE